MDHCPPGPLLTAGAKVLLGAFVIGKELRKVRRECKPNEEFCPDKSKGLMQSKIPIAVKDYGINTDDKKFPRSTSEIKRCRAQNLFIEKKTGEPISAPIEYTTLPIRYDYSSFEFEIDDDEDENEECCELDEEE